MRRNNLSTHDDDDNDDDDEREERRKRERDREKEESRKNIEDKNREKNTSRKCYRKDSLYTHVKRSLTYHIDSCKIDLLFHYVQNVSPLIISFFFGCYLLLSLFLPVFVSLSVSSLSLSLSRVSLLVSLSFSPLCVCVCVCVCMCMCVCACVLPYAAGMKPPLGRLRSCSGEGFLQLLLLLPPLML